MAATSSGAPLTSEARYSFKFKGAISPKDVEDQERTAVLIHSSPSSSELYGWFYLCFNSGCVFSCCADKRFFSESRFSRFPRLVLLATSSCLSLCRPRQARFFPLRLIIKYTCTPKNLTTPPLCRSYRSTRCCWTGNKGFGESPRIMLILQKRSLTFWENFCAGMTLRKKGVHFIRHCCWTPSTGPKLPSRFESGLTPRFPVCLCDEGLKNIMKGSRHMKNLTLRSIDLSCSLNALANPECQRSWPGGFSREFHVNRARQHRSHYFSLSGMHPCHPCTIYNVG